MWGRTDGKQSKDILKRVFRDLTRAPAEVDGEARQVVDVEARPQVVDVEVRPQVVELDVGAAHIVLDRPSFEDPLPLVETLEKTASDKAEGEKKGRRRPKGKGKKN